MFWGLIMDSGKRYTQTVERAFHVSMACLESSTADNDNVSVMLCFDNKEYILCTLNRHKAIQSPLDLNFQSGDRIAFLSTGKGRVHLTGYLLETDEEDDDLEDEEMDSLDAQDSFEKSESFNKGKGKRKNEPEETKSKKPKIEAEKAGESSSDEDDEDDNDDTMNFEGDSDDDDDNDDEDDDEDEDSDEEVDVESPKHKTPETKKQGKLQMKSPNESQQIQTPNETQLNKNKTPNNKQKNKSFMEKQQKNKTPVDKQKHESPNMQGANTPNQKTPGNQMNGMSNQQQSSKKNRKEQDTPKGNKTPGEINNQQILEGGVIIENKKKGNGAVAKPGRQVSVYYTGRLQSNNKQFDATNQGPGFKFRLGCGEVIKGWDIGLKGMKVGGKRRIICPAALAYGSKGSPPAIPPNSTLMFDVELKAVN